MGALEESLFDDFDLLGDLIHENETLTPRDREVSPLEAKKRSLLLKRFQELDAIYMAWWVAAHQTIIDFVQPYSGQFYGRDDENKGFQRDQQIVDNTAGDSARKLVAAIETAATSAARVWHTYAPEDPRDAEVPGNSAYCHDAQTIMFALLARSMFYVVNHNVIEDGVGPATGVMMIEPDPDEVFRFTHLPVGSYRLSTNAKGRNDRLVRIFTMTAAQMVEEFGFYNCSMGAQQAHLNDQIQVEFQVLQVIEPRTQRDPKKLDAKNKPWASYWLEIGGGLPTSGGIPGVTQSDAVTGAGPQGLLRESGYDIKPFSVFRWGTNGLDAYGKKSPGWTAIGDTMALQALQMEAATNIARIGTPPLSIPDELRTASLLPNAKNYVSRDAKSVKIEPTIVIPPTAITVMQEEKKEHRSRIVNAFYGDVLFLISNGGQSTSPVTAEEIKGKKAEQLLQLGSAFTHFSEYLKDAIAPCFHYAQLAGKLPKPPPGLAKKGKLNLTFQNPLVNAQKTVEFGALQQGLSMAQATATAKEAGVDQVDFDEILVETWTMLGLNPNTLKPTDRLAQERQANAQAAQQQQQAAALQAGSSSVKDLSSADPEKLQQLLAQFGPNAQAQGGGVQ
jgi:hypothetical protein